MWKKICFALMMLLILALGCGKQATTPEDTNNSEDNYLTVPLPDGYLPGADMPGVLEPILEKHKFPGGGADDLDWITPTLMPPDVNDSKYDVYVVTMLWGSFFDAHSNSELTDWSGSLSVNGEAVIDVKYVIDFEPGQDSLIPVDANWHAVWISRTHNDFDGLSVFVFLRNDVVYITAPLLTFETKAITLKFDFGQLNHFERFYRVDDYNGVLIHSRRIWHEDCPNGFLFGSWIKGEFGSGEGAIRGIWQNSDMDSVGLLSGRFWHGDEMYGKFQASVSGLVTDQVIAELHGVWHYDDMRMCPMCGEGHGKFYGIFHNLINDHWGRVRGTFGDYSVPPDDAVMPFEGRWRKFCPHDNLSQPMQEERH